MQNIPPWRPKLNEVVLYQPLRKKKGLISPPVLAIVQALYNDGGIRLKLKDGTIKVVKIETLKSIE